MFSTALEYLKNLLGNIKIPQWMLGCNNILTALFMFAGGIYIFRNIFGGIGISVVFMATKAFLDSKQEAHKTLVRIGRAVVVIILGYLILRSAGERFFGSFASFGGRNPIEMVAVPYGNNTQEQSRYSDCFIAQPSQGMVVKVLSFQYSASVLESFPTFSEPSLESGEGRQVHKGDLLTIIDGPTNIGEEPYHYAFWRVRLPDGSTRYITEWYRGGDSVYCLLGPAS